MEDVFGDSRITAVLHGLPVGAGTVISLEQVREVAAGGAAFTVAPGFDPAVATASAGMGLPHLPGVATPGEIQAALRHGLIWLKAFPASVLGPARFTAMPGPFPQIKLVATGGPYPYRFGRQVRDGIADIVICRTRCDSVPAVSRRRSNGRCPDRRAGWAERVPSRGSGG